MGLLKQFLLPLLLLMSRVLQAFVQFADVPSAQKAKDAIHGRMFAGNIVQAFHVSLHSFQSIPASITI
jgi:hypothetical protein